jgi:23S rRNA (adenine1618-N6)-methyltransferase
VKDKIKIQQKIKSGLHPRNRHRSRYNFNELVNCSAPLAKYVKPNKYNDESIDFSNPDAVMALNQAILKFFYNVNIWEIPKNYLIPPIPGRADYIHQVADLLGSQNEGVIPTGNRINILDIGVGANCVYPIIANSEYGWNFIGSDIDQIALESSSKIVTENNLSSSIKLRLQNSKLNIFKGIIAVDDYFDFTISNPPFHSSIEEAQSANERKNKNLNHSKSSKQNHKLNFGGMSNELWCEGGESAFVIKMIKESIEFKTNCFWFSSLVSKKETLPSIYQTFKEVGVQDFKTIDMEQGQKKSRIVAWTFHSPQMKNEWRKKKRG